MLKRLPIGQKLTLVVALPVAATILFAAVGYPTLQSVKIGSSTYGEVIEAKDLVADILPPPEFLVESFLTLHQIADAQTRNEYDELRTRLATFEADYISRHQYWVDALADEPDETSRLLTVESYESATRFWSVVDSEFLPAVEERFTTGDSSKVELLLNGELTDLFESHRASIVKVVPGASARVTANEAKAERSVRNGLVTLGIVLALLVSAAIAFAVVVARTIIGPIHRLRDAANNIVDELSAADAEDRIPELAPVELETSSELTSAADSFNAVASTTVGLLEKQALVRRNTAEIYVNLGRRNRSLLGRTLGIISRLEQDERNPATLDELFRLDHLTTRMRRNAENLLVLAGANSARNSERPADVADVVRGALSEIEDYTRVDVVKLESATIGAKAVADLTHLMAELVENATVFSPPTTRVKVEGLVVPEGYVLTVIDEGMGMKAETLERANERISGTTVLDTTPLTTLGLHVVGRLAARHDMIVRLAEGPTRGTVAKVVVPTAVLAELSPTDAAKRPAAKSVDTDKSDNSIEIVPSPTDSREDNATVDSAEDAPREVDEHADSAETGVVEAVEADVAQDEQAQDATAEEPASEDAAAAPAGAGGFKRRVKGAQLDGLALRTERKAAAPSAASAGRDRDRLSSFQSGVRKAEYDSKRPADTNATTEED